MKTSAKTFTFTSGSVLPLNSFGTCKAVSGVCAAALRQAIDTGYRHIDCAAVYMNEKELGTVFAEYITGENPKKFAGLQIGENTSVERDGDDPWNISWTAEGVILEQTWRGFEDAHAAGLVRNIGVSNYSSALLMELMRYAKVPPAVHQYESHPLNQRAELVDPCGKLGSHITFYSILGSGMEGPMQNAVPAGIAEKHGVSVAAVFISWGLGRAVACLRRVWRKRGLGLASRRKRLRLIRRILLRLRLLTSSCGRVTW